jgi:hypothetical protein
VLIAAIPPLMLKTPTNPGGLPIEVFDESAPALRAIARNTTENSASRSTA